MIDCSLIKIIEKITVISLSIGYIIWLWYANRDGRPVFKYNKKINQGRNNEIN